MHINELKKYIFDNKKIELVLEHVGCHHIKYHPTKNYYSCGNPDGDNKSAVTISNDQYLNCRNYTRDIGDKADLITLVQFYRKEGFRDAIKYIHRILNLSLTYSANSTKSKTGVSQKIQDPLDIFKRVLKRRVNANKLDYEVLDENAFNDFVPYIHTSWFREGIIKKTIDMFGLAYSYKYKRTVVPLRYWLTGELLGFNMRTSIENCEAFDIPKYYTTPNYPKSINLFGLWENYSSILKNKSVVVFESEKSVLKRHSRNDETCVALSGHSMSHEQASILIGLDVDITIALDNDVGIHEVRSMCEKFYGIRNVYYIKDSWGLLGDKDSPADTTNKIYGFLFKYRTKYDVSEHGKYVKKLKC